MIDNRVPRSSVPSRVLISHDGLGATRAGGEHVRGDAIRGLLAESVRSSLTGLIAICAELERRERSKGKRAPLIEQLREAHGCFVAEPARARAILERIRPILAAESGA